MDSEEMGDGRDLIVDVGKKSVEVIRVSPKGKTPTWQWLSLSYLINKLVRGDQHHLCIMPIPLVRQTYADRQFYFYH
jgi:hypothetical protein